MTKQLLTTTEAAAYLNVSKAFLERDRIEHCRVPYVRIGSRIVRYRSGDLEAYLESQLSQPITKWEL